MAASFSAPSRLFDSIIPSSHAPLIFYSTRAIPPLLRIVA